MAAVVTFFFLLWSLIIAQFHKESDGSYRCLLPPAVQLQRSSTKKAAAVAVAFFFLLWSSTAT
jgi:hypothetical protein